MRYVLGSLLRNLRAGLRLAFFLPVDRLAFRIDLPQLLLLFALSAAIDVVGDWFRASPPQVFALEGAGPELYAGALLLLCSAIVAIVNRQRPLALAVPVLVLASLPLVQALHYVPYTLGPDHIPAEPLLLAEYAIVSWIVIVLIRSVAVAFAPMPAYGWLRAIGGGLLLAAPIWFGNALLPSVPWWRGDGEVAPASIEGFNAGSEAVLAAQSFLLDHALSHLEDERPAQVDLYYVGFAPDGRTEDYRGDAEAALKTMDTRWGTEGRSILLLNNPQTLITTPFATVTNLRETLNEIGAIIDPEDDVVMLYLASRGTPEHALVAEQPPLSLLDLTPAGLRQLLDDAEIKWRIIVVSACHSSAFAAALSDANTLVITDAGENGIAFGCDGRTPPTTFGGAFFDQGLAKGDTFAAAFEKAKAAVAQREADAKYAPPSQPQMIVGTEMAAKLRTLRSRGTGGLTAQRAPWVRRG